MGLPNPNKLFFCFHKLDETIFVHRKPDGTYTKKKGFEGAAFCSEKTTEELLKADPFLLCITVAEMSKKLPVYLNFPTGHPLSDFQIRIVSDMCEVVPQLKRVK
jgi:hypothetical protein